MSHKEEDNDSSDDDIFVVKHIKPVNKFTQQAIISKYMVSTTPHANIMSTPDSSAKALKGRNNFARKYKVPGKSKKNVSTIKNKVIESKEKHSRGEHHREDHKKISDSKKEENCIKDEDIVLINSTVNSPSAFLVENEKISTKDITQKNPFYDNSLVAKKTGFSNEDGRNIVNMSESSEVSKKRKSTELYENNLETLEPNISLKKSAIKSTNGFYEEKVEILDSSLVSDNIKLFSSQEDQTLEPENIFNDFLNDQSFEIENTLRNTDSTSDFDEEKWMTNSKLLSCSLKEIINCVIQNQKELEEKTLKNGNSFEKLLSDEECEIAKKFFTLNEKACKVYVRMLCRKKDWHRVSSINYKDISDDLQKEFNMLHKENFVDVQIWEEDLKTQLLLLNKSEIVQLCKNFKIPLKFNLSCKKIDIINTVISNSKTQISVLEMMQGKPKKSRLDLLKKEVEKCLGMCIKLNNVALSFFKKIFVLFSFAHYYDEEEKRFSDQLFMYTNVQKNILKFPKYQISPTVIFQTNFDFVQYQEALSLKSYFEIAVSAKKYEEFEILGNKAKEEFQKLLKDENYQKRFVCLEPHLRKFSAGTIYAKILSLYCKTFKRKTENKKIIEIFQILLNQNLFLQGKRGIWYEILIQAYENLKKNDLAAEVLIESLNDTSVSEVQRFSLKSKGLILLRKKSININEIIKKNLNDLCLNLDQDIACIEIRGKVLEGNAASSKSVYIKESENGKLFTSVEEHALLYYKSKGYTKGYHVEGFILQSVYFLLFFDIIYELSPTGVFQSLYQRAPLDFYSKSFYLNRKEAIDARLNEMCQWTEEELEKKINSVYYDNLNVSYVLTYTDNFTPELFCELIKCITVPVLALICERFVKNFGITKSGFPDLTMWNPETKMCKFVEVKSPNDKLSPGQKLWLNFLRTIGVDCEVCNVKNVSSKSCF